MALSRLLEFVIFLSIFISTNQFPREGHVSENLLNLSSQRYSLCGRYVCPPGGKFVFSPDTIYTYAYKLDMISQFENGSSSGSMMQINLFVEIKINSCEGQLKIKSDMDSVDDRFKFNEESADNINKLYNELTRTKLRFSFYDGAVKDICPSRKETIISLNIKKGILSALQNKMKRFDVDAFLVERDVNGVCPTHYNLEKINGTSLIIKKSKEISACTERYQLHSILPTSRFIFQTRYHKWSPLNSTVICHQTIDHGVPIDINCQENHRLQIFGNDNNTLHTTITQHFSLLSEDSYFIFNNYFSDPVYDIILREDLAFDHTKPKKSETSELEESEDYLIQLCNITKDEFQPEAASIFSKFTHSARHLSYYALKKLYERSKSLCPTGMKQVENSLPFLRSTSGIKLMKDLLKGGSIDGSVANGWLFAISLFSRPDDDVIESVTSLILDEEDTTKEMILSVSAVIHSYCAWHWNCAKQETVFSTITHLELMLNSTLIDDTKYTKSLVILKALGNSGVHTATIIYTLSAIARSPLTSVEMKVAAIEAYRRLPCDSGVSFLLPTYTNVENDVEVRIASYLQLMKCPSYSTIKVIKETLKNETVNQVGVFVWSHLKNVMKSSMPNAMEIQAILQDYDLITKLNTDFRTFSRNYEFSFYSNEYGFGGFVVSNVIFSPKSYIPRTFMTNITLNIFGEAINVLEIQVNIEGFERYVEALFKGGSLFDLGKLEKQLRTWRVIRSIPPSIINVIRQLPNYVAGNFPEPKITFSGKVFGNELFYSSYTGEREISNAIESFNPYKVMQYFFSGKQIKLDYSTVFADISYVVPTGAGVPLELNAIGIIISNVDISASLNASNFLSNRQLSAKGKLKPRLSINFERTMGVPLVYEETQLTIKNKIYTSSGIEGAFQMNGYDNITASFNLPMNKFDLLSIESELSFKNNSENKEVIAHSNAIIPFEQEVSCFWSLPEQILGLKICSARSVLRRKGLMLSPSFIFYRPFKFSLFIEKTDPTAHIYLFKYSSRSLPGNDTLITTEFETPDSIVKRNMVANIHVRKDGYNVTVLINSNQSEIFLQGVHVDTAAEKVLNFTLDIDKQRHIDFIMELKMKQEKRASIYWPRLYLAITSKPIVELSGTYKWVEKKGISQCDVNLEFKTNKFESNITGYIKTDDSSTLVNIHIKYQFENLKREYLKFESKYNTRTNIATKAVSVYAVSFQIESSFYKNINFLTSLKHQMSEEQVDTKFDFISNPSLEDDRQKLYLQCAFIYFKTYNRFKLDTYMDIRKQITDMNFRLGFTYEDAPTSSTSIILVRYAKDRDIIIRLDIIGQQTAKFSYEIKLNVTLPAVRQPMVAHLRVYAKDTKEKHTTGGINEYHVDFSGTWFSGHTAMAKGFFRDESNHYTTNYYVKLQLKSRIFNEILCNGRLTIGINELKISALVSHNNTEYSILLRHVSENTATYETYAEYTYNYTTVYFINNHVNVPEKELVTELHLHHYRDIHLALRGKIRRWNTNAGIEVKWDLNRDPSRRFIVGLRTKSERIFSGNSYTGTTIFEYPGHASEASFTFQIVENTYDIDISVQMSPTSLIRLIGFVKNEISTRGIGQFQVKLLTPFKDWTETSIAFGLYSNKLDFCTNGSLVWQSNQNIAFDIRGAYLMDEYTSSVSFSSSLNSTLRDLSAIAFNFAYESVADEIRFGFLIQPNPKYTIGMSTFAAIKHLQDATEYIVQLHTKTPFFESSVVEFNNRLILSEGNKLVYYSDLHLDDKLFTLAVKGVFRLFDESKLCLKITSPYERYSVMSGKIGYEPENKHVYVNMTGPKVEIGLDFIYVYNNLSDFNIVVSLLTPLSYFSKLQLVGMFNGKMLDVKCGWNSFMIGFTGVSYFNSWTDLEYGLKLVTPIDTIKEGSATFKIFIKDQIVFISHVSLSNVTKAGIRLHYDTERLHVISLDECSFDANFNANSNNKTIILRNGLLEIDTLLYPTLVGMYKIMKNNNRFDFNFYLSVLFLKIDLQDSLDYISIWSLNNTLNANTSIDMFSSLSCRTTVEGISKNDVNTNITLQLTSFNKTSNSGMNIHYNNRSVSVIDHSSIGQSIKIAEVYTYEINLITPIESFTYCDMLLTMKTYNQIYEFVSEIILNKNEHKLQISGNMRKARELLDVSGKVSVQSLQFGLPPITMRIVRDFSQMEKEVLFSLTNNTDNRDMFAIRSKWYINNRNAINILGEIISPFPILDHLKGSLQYIYLIETKSYNLEIYMKYSNKTEMKAKAILAPSAVSLNLETPIEGLRNAHFTGTLKDMGGGQQKIDAIMITDNSFKIRGISSTSDRVPFALDGKLLQGKADIVVSSVNFHVKKTAGGYDILAYLESRGKILKIQTEINDNENKTRVIDILILTSKGNTESLEVNGKLTVQHPGVYLFTVRGESHINDRMGLLTSEVSVWFRDEIRAIFAMVDCSILKANLDIFTIWDVPDNIYGKVSVFLTGDGMKRQVVHSDVFYNRSPVNLTKLTTGLSVRLYGKLAIGTNLTLLLPTNKDIDMISYVVLPNKENHVIVGRYNQDDKSETFKHLILYKTKKDNMPCFTISNINRKKIDIRGLFAIKCGIKNPLLILDNFSGKEESGKLTMDNTLKSNTLSDTLLTKIRYEEIKGIRDIRLKFYYPPTVQISSVDITFQSMSNFKCLVNTTTPFITVPYFVCELYTKTDTEHYIRYGKVYLHEKPALFNLTHWKQGKTNSVLNEGQITVLFPVTTWHECILLYVYEDWFSTSYNGSTELIYNKDKVIEGNFTRHITAHHLSDRDIIYLEIGNKFVPLGVNYAHQTNSSTINVSSVNFRRMELFKLHNASSLNFTFEIIYETLKLEEWTTLKVINFNKSVAIKSHTVGNAISESTFMATLRPDVWLNYCLQTRKQTLNDTHSKGLELRLSYPRRNYSLIGEYYYGESFFGTQVRMVNHQTIGLNAVGILFHTKKLINNHRQAYITFFHPSFVKNVTLSASLFYSNTIIADMKLNLEYSNSNFRKVTLSATLEDKSSKGGRNYALQLQGKHPASSFKVDLSGLLKSESGIHIIANNFTYGRSYITSQWMDRIYLNKKEDIFEVQRGTSQGVMFLHGDYKFLNNQHVINANVFKNSDTNMTGVFYIDFINKKMSLLVNLSEDSTDRLQMEGSAKEQREVQLSIWRWYNDLVFPQVTFYVALNNSRFLSSEFLWRTDLSNNVMHIMQSTMTHLWEYTQEYLEFWTSMLRTEASNTVTDIWNDLKPFIRDFLDDINNVRTIQDNINYFKSVFIDSYNKNEFFLRDIHDLYILVTQDISLLSKLGSVPKIVNEVWESMGETGKSIRTSLLWFINTAKELYEKLMTILDELLQGGAEEHLSKIVSKITTKFDNFVKDLHILFISSAERVIKEVLYVISDYWKQLLQLLEPTFIEVVHHLESTLVTTFKKFIDFLNTKQEGMAELSFLRSDKFKQQVDSLYKDLIKNDFLSNVGKYCTQFFDVLYEYYISKIPFRKELQAIGSEVLDEINELYKLPLVSYTVDNIKSMYEQAKDLYYEWEVNIFLQKLIPFAYKGIYENTFTALDNEIRNYKPKTKFLFDPENGVLRLEQKLPFPWHAFNETPIYEEIAEYKLFKKYQSYFNPSMAVFWTVYNEAVQLLNPDTWLPPFNGQAMILGIRNYVTFDKCRVYYNSKCAYLLLHDYHQHKFSLVVNYEAFHTASYQQYYSLSVIVNDTVITIDFPRKKVEVYVGTMEYDEKLPVQINNTRVFFDGGIVTVTVEGSFRLECVYNYDLCTVYLSGWYFGKVSGLLGTMNNEPNDDIQTGPNANSWALSAAYDNAYCFLSNTTRVSPHISASLNEACYTLFQNKTSPFESCFSKVDTKPYEEICYSGINRNDFCTSAAAYSRICTINNIPIRVPTECVSCILENGSRMEEGSFKNIRGNGIIQSSDVVFIVEAKLCNRDMITRRNIVLLISSIAKELENNGYTNNRFALVLFGGNDAFDKAHSVSMDNKIFANSSNFVNYFANIKIGDGNMDIFSALRFAIKLPFRESVSKTFVLVPCSSCNPNDMELDYASLHHILMEKSITLHILMNSDIVLNNSRSGKIFGVDSNFAFTKTDARQLVGDKELLKQVKLTKSVLGYCTPIALESNGTIFNAKKLEMEHVNGVKKFVAVFSKRLALTAKPSSCQNCECSADAYGVPYFDCTPCFYPAPINFDFGFEEDNFSFLHSSQVLNTNDTVDSSS